MWMASLAAHHCAFRRCNLLPSRTLAAEPVPLGCNWLARMREPATLRRRQLVSDGTGTEKSRPVHRQMHARISYSAVATGCADSDVCRIASGFLRRRSFDKGAYAPGLLGTRGPRRVFRQEVARSKAKQVISLTADLGLRIPSGNVVILAKGMRTCKRWRPVRRAGEFQLRLQSRFKG